MQRGGHSKDAWVLSDELVRPFSMLRPRAEPLELRRVSRVVPSRVADNTFWLGRYVERSENVARILRSMIPRVRPKRRGGARKPVPDAQLSWYPAQQAAPEPAVAAHLRFVREGTALDAAGHQALRQPAMHPRGGYRARGGNVRERLSADMMLLINRLRAMQ